MDPISSDREYERRVNAYTMETINGRIDTSGLPPSRINFELSPDSTNPNQNFSQNAVSSFLTSSPSQKIFLSESNINRIQNLILQKVKEQSGFEIARQSDRELQIIMRSIYLQYGRNPEDSQLIVDEITRLNNKVMEYCVPNIISNIQQYLRYKQDASSLPVPLERAKNISNKGTKTLMYNVF